MERAARIFVIKVLLLHALAFVLLLILTGIGVRNAYGRAQKQAVDQAPGWRVLAPVPLQTICVRHEPEGLSGEALDRHTLAWAERVNRSGRAYVTPAQLQGSWMVRLSLGSTTTEQADVEALWQTLQWSVAA